MRTRVWEDVPADEERVRASAAALDVPLVIARLLCQRGFDDPEAARTFMNPSMDQLHDPFLLTGMRAAVDRLTAAIARDERIVIHGDYDVDGITSTVILQRALELLGADVVHFVPDRLKDGYGLQPGTVDRVVAMGARLIVSVDCGIRAVDAAQHARDLGVDLIITDHHEPEATLPAAVAVLNPKRADCLYPDKWLAGVGVAFKLVQALLAGHPQRDALIPHFLKVAAIGTLADVVPLVGENRIIARHGLRSLSAPRHSTGLQALLEECGLLGRPLDSFHVSFVLAPRLNAAGRMNSADLAVELLLLKGQEPATKARASELARRLTAENTRRQEEEARILAEARRMVERDPEVGGQNLLIVAAAGWHRGVIGIVASKLVDLFHKPTLVLSIENGVAQGSARSIASFDLLAGLEACADVFVRFGGHRQAAGVTIEEQRIPELRRRLTAFANDQLSPEDLMPRLRIDSPLGLREISGDVIDGLDRLGPFGASNPKPVFRASPIELMQPPKRLKERHLALLVRQNGRVFRAMAWRAADREDYLNANRHELELAYTLGQNEFRGERTTELTVADVRVPVVEAAG